MKSKMAVQLAVAALVCLAGAMDDYSRGQCPKVPPMKDFDVNKFLGKWYVIENYDDTSSCLVKNYSKVSETQLNITEGRQFVVLDILNFDRTIIHEGKLDIHDTNNAAQMKVYWPRNIFHEADYVVADTDYETYACIHECRDFLFRTSNRQSAAILSRTRKLEDSRVNELKFALKSARVDVSHFNKIDQSNCAKLFDDYQHNRN